ncbi:MULTISPECIES: ribonuclease E activity regulator RraA [Methylococcus]|uniref:4-hydroxy-4-methyl-2-oxoglutarate aldolase n=1 Tax=Methylococcus capsulatus TaxID=414 RepID=A0ABZ2F627_METCP|nr:MULTISPECIES: ribonuclease E activity regulator RraA [Methylococcus]MDF9392016.1 RraA family protein [Methylococcus capsulatus]
MEFTTADLCDRFHGTHPLQIAEPLFRTFGAVSRFHGRITTLKVFEDNVLIRETVAQKADGRVLVIDGGASHRCALLGGNLARLAADNGWQGIIVYGCVRDSVELGTVPIGIRALHTHPLKSHQRGGGDKDCLITFASVNFRSDHYLYADEDGIVVAEEKLI